MSQLPSTPTPAKHNKPTNQSVADALAGARSAAIQPASVGADLLNIEAQPLIRHFSSAVDASPTAEELFKALFNVVATETECLAMWRVQVDATDKKLRASAISDDNASAVWLSVENQLTDVVQRAESIDQICSALVLPDRKHIVVAAPLESSLSSSESREVLTACFVANDQTSLRLQWLLGIASQSICQWAQRQQLITTQSQSQTLSDTLQLLNVINDSENPTEAAIAIVNNLRRLFKANQVAIAETASNGAPRLLAVSDVEKLDAGAANNKQLLSAIAQSVATGTTIAFPNKDATQDAARVLPLENWCHHSHGSAALSLPMRLDDGSIVGALLITFDDESEANQQPYIEKMVSLISKQFDVVSRANRSTCARFKAQLRKNKSTARKIIIGALICAGLLAVPMPYRVNCQCQLQPTERRFVAAPFDGILEKSLVEVGEVVSKDQVIARLEGRQLRIELAGLEAELEGARRQRDSSLAMREIAQSQIARSEMNRLGSQIQLLNNRMKELEVRSPVNGVVVAGDMEKAQGAPLEMGQNLFEVAPLETMVAEIGIPETEIQYVKLSDSATLKINAFPYQTWSGNVQQIHPRAEIVADQTVFIAEVEIDNVDGQLRPGMEGNAQISTRWSPIGWNLFHNAWESLRYWTIW